jgi:hypothetical protein
MIFQYALKQTSHGPKHNSPTLLAALRAATDLYGEALEVYYKINTVYLDITTVNSFSRLKPETVKLVRKVAIDFVYDVLSDTKNFSYVSKDLALLSC